MDMNITHDRIGRILIRMLSGYIGIRADNLKRSRLGVPVVGTALMHEFLYLDFGFRNWFRFYVGIGISALLCFRPVPKFSLSLVMNLVLLHTFYDWVFICLFLSCC